MSWVVWLIIWVVLLGATGLGGYRLGMRLWRSVKAVMAQAEQTMALAGDFDAALSRAEAGARAEATVAHLIATTEQREQWRRVRFDNKLARRIRKNDRRRRTLARWRDVGSTGQ